MSPMSSTVSLRTSSLDCVRVGRAGARPPRSADGFERGLEPAGVALLGACERLEPLRDLLEALVARGLREARVHLGVLIGLTGDGRVQVVGRRTHGNTGDRVADFGEEVEVAERVTRLTLRHRAEQGGDIGVALD